MEINNLLESSNQFKSMQQDANKLADKWKQSGLLEGLGEKESNNMAMILENQAKQIVSEANSTNVGGGSFTAGAGEQWAGVALPLVRKVFAQIVAQDFVSVQPMNLPSGLVFYLDFKYGTGANGFNDGENLYGNVSSASSKMSVDEDVADGLYGAGKFGYSINPATFAGLGAGDLAGTLSTGKFTTASVDLNTDLADFDYDLDFSQSAAAAGNGTKIVKINILSTDLTLPDTEGVRAFSCDSADITTVHRQYTKISGTTISFIVTETADIDANTALSIGYLTQPVDNDRGDFEANSSAAVDTSISIPEIDVKLASEAIVAKTRKLKAQWTPEFAQDLNAYHSIDAEAELTSLLSEYISMEIDLEILDMLIQNAVTTEKWSAENNKVYNGSAWTTATSDFYNTQGQWFQTLGTKVQKVSNKIHQKTLRGGANFIVTSPTVATILESIPGYAAATDGDQQEFNMGVQKVGSLANRFKVYKNPYMTENIMLLGFRGSQFLEAGAVYAPYVPLLMTPLVYDPETFTPRKGLMTRYAKKMIRPEFYGKIFISDVGQI
tara:strand:- start:2883 stop:4538 length:1656 start_codon:yes stop_codon:yes gene_type:complete